MGGLLAGAVSLLADGLDDHVALSIFMREILPGGLGGVKRVMALVGCGRPGRGPPSSGLCGGAI